MTIRRALPEDAGALALVGAATFLESYAQVLTREDVVAHCAEAHAPASYARWLADPETAIWVATVGEGVVVAYAVMARSDLPEARADDLELRRIYVLAPFQGGGLGRTLLEAMTKEARAREARRLTLGVYDGNPGALAFYEREGFRRIGTRTFTVGERTYGNLILALEL